MSQSQVKTAVITGAAGGIGKELARRLAERKLNLVLVDLNEEAIHTVIQELGLDDTNSLAVPADVSKEEDVQNYVNQAVAKFGTIDYFANNAGIEGPSGLVEELSVKSLDLVYNVNVRGVFLGLQYVIPVMKKQNPALSSIPPRWQA